MEEATLCFYMPIHVVDHTSKLINTRFWLQLPHALVKEQGKVSI